MSACPLCDASRDEVLWRDDFCRVIAATEPDYPGFLRVVLAAHVREMTDLAPAERARLMAVVFAAEAALVATLAPDKINLASLGNVVPHLHWHVIPRFRGDPHFPNPVWGAKTGQGAPQPGPSLAALRAALAAPLGESAA